MNKEELIQFLKENLKIAISNSHYEEGITVAVSLWIGEEKISQMEDYINF